MTKDITITDKLTNKKINLTFEQFYDLKIGLLCAADMYAEVNKKSRSKEFLKLAKMIDG